jgi:hypothetical protein
MVWYMTEHVHFWVMQPVKYHGPLRPLMSFCLRVSLGHVALTLIDLEAFHRPEMWANNTPQVALCASRAMSHVMFTAKATVGTMKVSRQPTVSLNYYRNQKCQPSSPKKWCQASVRPLLRRCFGLSMPRLGFPRGASRRNGDRRARRGLRQQPPGSMVSPGGNSVPKRLQKRLRWSAPDLLTYDTYGSEAAKTCLCLQKPGSTSMTTVQTFILHKGK